MYETKTTDYKDAMVMPMVMQYMSFLREYILEAFLIFEYEVTSLDKLNSFLEDCLYGDIWNRYTNYLFLPTLYNVIRNGVYIFLSVYYNSMPTNLNNKYTHVI